jgi:hypothetical protein
VQQRVSDDGLRLGAGFALLDLDKEDRTRRVGLGDQGNVGNSGLRFRRVVVPDEEGNLTQEDARPGQLRFPRPLVGVPVAANNLEAVTPTAFLDEQAQLRGQLRCPLRVGSTFIKSITPGKEPYEGGKRPS